MDSAEKFAILIRGHTATFRAQVGVVVRPVEEVGHTLCLGHCSKEATHVSLILDYEANLKKKNVIPANYRAKKLQEWKNVPKFVSRTFWDQPDNAKAYRA
jgi:hypothetical protein